MSEYITVAETSCVPLDRGLRVKVGGRELAIFNVDGSFYALDGVCPHRGGLLGQGFTQSERVYCPMHGWEFNVKTGACIDYPDKSVSCYAVRVVDGQISVNI